MASSQKLILVIGATGAQGSAVVKALLAPSADGSPSPYAVRALTRDPDNARARGLSEQGVECVKGMCFLTSSEGLFADTCTGSFEDLDSVRSALEGVYGAYINTDGFTGWLVRQV